MRRTELTAARRGALARISATQAAVPQQIVGTLTGIDPDGAGKVQVSVGGASSLSIVAAAGKYVPGALVLIAVDAAGKPLRVLGPLTDRPEGLDAEAEAPSPIWAWPTLAPREITEEERQSILDTVENLAEAQESLTGIGDTADTALTQSADALLAAAQAAEKSQKALDNAILRIDSSRGTTFKNDAISTVLSVTIIRGGQLITDIDDLHAIYGPGAYLEWWWRRMGDTDFGVISSADSRLSHAGFSLNVSPSDVDEQTVFQCILHT